jgi:tyrosyl-tRNA synthetase
MSGDSRTVDPKTMDKIVSLSKRRGFIFPSSEIYGGLASAWDYGPLGVELKANLHRFWWKEMTQLHDNIVGLDAAILMHPTVWKASGHVDNFSDMMVEDTVTNERYRWDHLTEEQRETKTSPNGNPLSEPRQFNLMFETHLGPASDSGSKVYLRPETAQGIYVNFKNVVQTSRVKIPFGIAQVGKAFRNEIVTKNFIFRTVEFEQMEMQYFVKPGDDDSWFEFWKAERMKYYEKLGIDMNRLRFEAHGPDELAHYAKAAFDIQYQFPFGWQELEGIHNRTDFDLSRHSEFCGKEINYLEEETKERYIPYIVETSAGLTRSVLMVLCDAYEGRGGRRERRADGAPLPSESRADSGGGLPPRQERRPRREGAGDRDGAAGGFYHLLRSVGSDRPPLSPTGRDRYSLLHHRRLRDDGAEHRYPSVPGLDGAGTDPRLGACLDDPAGDERLPEGGELMAAAGRGGEGASPTPSAPQAHPHRPGALERLKERGFFAQCTDEERLRERMDAGPLTFYVGVDPTGDSLHVGHLIPVYALAHLAEFGHRGIVIVGGGTARIGDPSGKTEMRKMLTVEQIDANAATIGGQIERFLATRDVEFTMVNNAEWLADLNYIEFLRDIGRHFSVNRMLTFEAYKLRLEQGLSFIEFNYQLLQSYDFLKLYQTRGCQLQIGGDDQWGNIVAGADLIRRIEGHEVESFGLTFPLVTRADGKKMGKSEKGAIFLDVDRVSPYEFFQYWRNVPDADVRKFLSLYTFLEVREIDEIMAGAESPNGEPTDAGRINSAKERLATEITALVHGHSAAEEALEAARALFAGGAAGGAAGGSGAVAMPSAAVTPAEVAAGIPVLELYVRAGLCSSNGEARRLVQQGGARINEVNVEAAEAVVDATWPGADAGELILRAGKKRYFRFTIG